MNRKKLMENIGKLERLIEDMGHNGSLKRFRSKEDIISLSSYTRKKKFLCFYLEDLSFGDFTDLRHFIYFGRELYTSTTSESTAFSDYAAESMPIRDREESTMRIIEMYPMLSEYIEKAKEKIN